MTTAIKNLIGGTWISVTRRQRKCMEAMALNQARVRLDELQRHHDVLNSMCNEESDLERKDALAGAVVRCGLQKCLVAKEVRKAETQLRAKKKREKK